MTASGTLRPSFDWDEANLLMGFAAMTFFGIGLLEQESYLAMAMAITLKTKVNRIILTRPAVEARRVSDFTGDLQKNRSLSSSLYVRYLKS